MDAGEERRDPARPVGLVLFPPHRPAAFRRRRLTFLAVYAGVAVALTVPAVPAVWGVHPLILGLPTSFAWVILSLATTFVALLWLYRSDGE